ncbi:MAG: hypothetical protein H6631_14145 [Anaerolineaceae bacterium]|nr:hypothetical protein [Anaerolineaceae bacterium]
MPDEAASAARDTFIGRMQRLWRRKTPLLLGLDALSRVRGLYWPDSLP